MISDNVEFLPPIFMPCFGSHFENFENAELLLVKFYVSIIIQLEVININVRNFKF